MKLKTINVANILRDYKDYEWIYQGVGFLRAYLDDEKVFRLHLWHPDIQVPDVGYIHTHNWDFTSRVVAGQIVNKTFMVRMDPEGVYYRDSIVPGLGTLVGHPERCTLEPLNQMLYMGGYFYHEKAETVHTIKLVGMCISVIERNFTRPKAVYSFRHRAEKWKDTKARPATEQELAHYIPQFKELLCKT
jgi:hypothetical protein